MSYGMLRPVGLVLTIMFCLFGAGPKVAAEGQSPDDNGADGFVLCQKTTYNFNTFAGTDCWGWQDTDGTEYACMGIYNGVVFVDITNNDVIDTVMGPQSNCGSTRWRDMKNYGQYMYAVSECTGTNQGLMIMDMSFLPDSVRLVRAYSVAGDVTCHNLTIDTAKGFAYLVKANYDGFRVISLASPTNPVEFPYVSTQDLHDVFARNDTVWCAEGNRHTWSMYDMANKNAPQLIARVGVPNGGYVHNVWPTADGQHVATTEETVGKTIKFWNTSDLGNIQLVGQYIAPSTLAHNVHFHGDRAYVSHYESGVAVVDISNPSSPQEVGRVDTYGAGESGNFNGCWGVFPHTASGKVYASHLDGRLVVLDGFEVSTANDTLAGSTVIGLPATKVKVDVSISNDYDMTGFVLPIDWAGPYNMFFDSVSGYGLRTAGWTKAKLADDPANRKNVWQFSSPTPIGPGSGPIASIYFRIPGIATGDSNLVRIGTAFLINAEISNGCFIFNPPTVNGVVKFPPPSTCCVGSTGNVDNDGGNLIDISDLTVLIDHLFIGLDPLVCDEEGNTDGSLDGNVDISDLSRLIDHLFISLAPVEDCL